MRKESNLVLGQEHYNRIAKVLTYVLSWRMKLEKLPCLKCLGRRLVENWRTSHTMKLLRARLHDTTESVPGSSTMSNIFVRKGGGPVSCNPSIGRGHKSGNELPLITSSFTKTPSMDNSWKTEENSEPQNNLDKVLKICCWILNSNVELEATLLTQMLRVSDWRRTGTTTENWCCFLEFLSLG